MSIKYIRSSEELPGQSVGGGRCNHALYKYVETDGAVIGVDHFGASAPSDILFREFGFTAQNVVEKVKQVIVVPSLC